MELEDLKKGWIVLDEKAGRSLKEKEDSFVNEIMNNRMSLPHKKLIQRYRITTILCFICPFCLMNQHNLYTSLGHWLAGGFFLFFVVMAIYNGGMWWKLSRLNYLQMTVKESHLETYRLERYKRQGFIVGLVMAVPLMAGYFFKLIQIEEMYTVWGACIGLLIGIIAGRRIHKQIKKQFQEIREVLGEE